MMFPVVLENGDTFLQEPLGSHVPALPRPPVTDSDPRATQAALARIRQKE
jgi:hypothetical protein